MHFPCKLFGSFKKKQYLCSRFREKHATVAQLVEQRIRNAWVGGSSPPSGSKEKNHHFGGSFFVAACISPLYSEFHPTEQFQPSHF